MAKSSNKSNFPTLADIGLTPPRRRKLADLLKGKAENAQQARELNAQLKLLATNKRDLDKKIKQYIGDVDGVYLSGVGAFAKVEFERESTVKPADLKSVLLENDVALPKVKSIMKAASYTTAVSYIRHTVVNNEGEEEDEE